MIDAAAILAESVSPCTIPRWRISQPGMVRASTRTYPGVRTRLASAFASPQSGPVDIQLIDLITSAQPTPTQRRPSCVGASRALTHRGFSGIVQALETIVLWEYDSPHRLACEGCHSGFIHSGNQLKPIAPQLALIPQQPGQTVTFASISPVLNFPHLRGL
jgi:hypothetical protein